MDHEGHEEHEENQGHRETRRYIDDSGPASWRTHTAGLAAEDEVAIPVTHRGVSVDCGYRADIIVADRVLLELKSVERLLPIHEAQILTYLKLSSLRINFDAIKLQHGIRRFVL
jgi:GxxExxY protein